MSLTVKTFLGAPLGENTYVITDDATGFKAVIDPGYYGLDVRMEIQSNVFLKYILLTHGHHDHYAAAGEYLEEYTNAVFAVPEGDERILSKGRENYYIANGDPSWKCPEAKLHLKEGDIIHLGETDLRVIATPGHTAGGICFATDNEVFTGDTLFRLSVGNTSFETGDWNALQDSIRNKLYTLDDDTVVWPGHGSPTTIGYEKRANPFV